MRFKTNNYFLIGLIWLAGLAPVRAAEKTSMINDNRVQKTALRCELQKSKRFLPDNNGHLQLLLISNQHGLKIFQESNSWGYYALTLVVMADKSKTYEIKRREIPWEKNWSTVDTVNEDESMTRDVNLCDGSWQIVPQLPSREVMKLNIVAHFQQVPDQTVVQPDVWTGHIESKSLEITIDKTCVDHLNVNRYHSKE